MVGVAIRGEAAGGVNGGGSAGERHEGFDEGCAVHQGEFTTAGAVNDFRVGAASGLLDHAVEGVESQSSGTDGDGVAVGVPSVGAEGVVEGVAVGVISGGDAVHAGNAIGDRRRLIGGDESRGVAGNLVLDDVAEGIIAKCLSPDGASIGLGDAGEVIGGVRAVLRVGSVQGIGDAEGSEAAV